MKLLEIFESIQGELPHMGMPCTIIRLAHCNIKCPYCDVTPDLQPFDMSIDDIVAKAVEFQHEEILVTGGEPLANSGVKELLQALYSSGFDITIETNGTVPLDGAIAGNCDSIVMDVKLFNPEFMDAAAHNLDWLGVEDAIKFVYRDALDLGRAYEFLDVFHDKIESMVIFSPTDVQQPMMARIMEIVKAYPHLDIRLQCQIHKVLGLG